MLGFWLKSGAEKRTAAMSVRFHTSSVVAVGKAPAQTVLEKAIYASMLDGPASRTTMCQIFVSLCDRFLMCADKF